jgi:serine/threonine-protein kinase
VITTSTLIIGKEVCPGYRLRRLRGRGAAGSVWEAEKDNGQVVALKFLPCEDTRVAVTEVRASQTVRSLRHPHLIHLEQVWCSLGYVLVTMELADGSLLDLLDAYRIEYGIPLPAPDVCNYLSQVAQALDFLNGHNHLVEGQRIGIQHCDIKPSNLLLCGEKVKVSDFGLSSLIGSPIKQHRRAGTLDYAAPEVFQGRLSDWTDQYALGVTYVQLRSGKLPFHDTPSSFRQVYVRPTPDLSMLDPLERPVIARALAATPQDRWPTCAEMMAHLRGLVL